jgi:Leucine-rich repeat (LRR) protein
MLKNTNLGDAGLAVLVRATNLNGLTALGLEQCKLTADADLAGLREAPCAANLVALWLGGNAIELTALNGWDRWQTLRVASLPKSLTPDGFTALSDRFPALEELHLAGAKALLKEPARVFAGLPSLTSLNLSTTGLKDAGMTALLASPFAHQLTTLRVNGCSLSDKALDALMASAARRLVHLDLSSNKLTDAVLTRLAAWEGLEHLTELRLGNNRKLTAAGHDALMASPYFDPVVFDVGKLKDEELRARLVTYYGDRLLHR